MLQHGIAKFIETLHCNILLQHYVASLYCSILLQHCIALLYSNIVLRCCNIVLQNCIETLYCNILMQYYIATLYCNITSCKNCMLSTSKLFIATLEHWIAMQQCDHVTVRQYNRATFQQLIRLQEIRTHKYKMTAYPLKDNGKG